MSQAKNTKPSKTAFDDLFGKKPSQGAQASASMSASQRGGSQVQSSMPSQKLIPQKQTQVPSEPNAEELEELLPPQEEEVKPKSRFALSKAAAIGICILIIVVAVIGLIVVIFFYNRKNEARTNEEQRLQSELNKANIAVAEERKNNTLLQMQLKNNEEQLRKQTQPQVPSIKAVVNEYREKKGLPGEDDYDLDSEEEKKEAEKKSKTQKSWDEMSKEERDAYYATLTPQEQKALQRKLANSPRATVADLQAGEEEVKRKNEEERDKLSLNEIKGHVNIKDEDRAQIFPTHKDDDDDGTFQLVHDNEDEETLIHAVKNGK